jgi:hypothetical protein
MGSTVYFKKSKNNECRRGKRRVYIDEENENDYDYIKKKIVSKKMFKSYLNNNSVTLNSLINQNDGGKNVNHQIKNHTGENENHQIKNYTGENVNHQIKNDVGENEKNNIKQQTDNTIEKNKMINATFDKGLILFFQYYIISNLIYNINLDRPERILHQDVLYTAVLLSLFSFIQDKSSNSILFITMLYIFSMVIIFESIRKPQII